MIEDKYIDPRIQFTLLVVIGVCSMFLGVEKLLIINLVAICYLVYNTLYLKALKCTVVVLLITCLHVLILSLDNQFLNYFGFLTFTILRLYPTITFASVIQEVPSGKLITSLQTLGIPKSILITLTVTLRFFPIIKKENETIQMSAKLRGLSISNPRNWLHPLLMFEYTFVPLMMRTLKISDELAASAMTKGIDYPFKRTSIYSNQIKFMDYIIFLSVLIVLILVFTNLISMKGIV